VVKLQLRAYGPGESLSGTRTQRRPMAARTCPVPRARKRRVRSGGLRCAGGPRSACRDGPPSDHGRAGAQDSWCFPSPIVVASSKKFSRPKINASLTPPALSTVRPQPSNDDFRGQEPVQAHNRFASLPTGAGLLLVGNTVRLLPIRSYYRFHDLRAVARSRSAMHSSQLQLRSR
jgi:hypothetical protein